MFLGGMWTKRDGERCACTRPCIQDLFVPCMSERRLRCSWRIGCPPSIHRHPLSPPHEPVKSTCVRRGTNEQRDETCAREGDVTGRERERKYVRMYNVIHSSLSVPCMSERRLRCSGRRPRRFEETPGSHMRTGALTAKKRKFLLPRPLHSR